MPLTNNEILIAAKPLNKIAYSDKPLPQSKEIKYLTVAEFEKKFGFTYSESIHGNRKQLAPFIEDKNYHQQLNSNPYGLPNFECVRERLKNPLDCLVLCAMGSTGHAVYTSRDLAPGEVLFLYAGSIEEIATDEMQGEYDYIWGVNHPTEQFKAVSPKHIGGLARFMQHLPCDHIKKREKLKAYLLSKFPVELIAAKNINIDDFVQEMMDKTNSIDNELDNLTFLNPDTRKKIQEANIDMAQIVLDGIPIVVCWTENGIEANKQVGFSYGHDRYWIIRSPRYFYEDGSLVPLTEYQSSKGLLSSMKNPNPQVLYNKGADFQKNKDFQSALNYFTIALQMFASKKGSSSEECGNCYSGLASSYRDLGRFQDAIDACDQAITILKDDSKKLATTMQKLTGCLELAKLNPTSLYDEATNDFKNARYHQAIAKLNFLLTIPQAASMHGYYHSTLASCYREIKDIDLAISHAEKAVELRKITKTDPALLKAAVAKLDGLNVVKLANEAEKLKVSLVK